LPLPAKHVEIVSKDLTLEEKRIFAGLAECARVRIHSFMAAGTLRANYMNVLSMLTRLRQACDSPVLVESAFSREEESTAEDSTAAARERAAALATGALESCQLCFDQVQRDGGCVTSCGHAFCYECILEYLYGESDKVDVLPSRRCPSCKEPLKPSCLFKLEALIPAPTAINGEPPLLPSKVSTKTSMVLEAIDTMVRDDPAAKAIVFSSFTKYLDILETHLRTAGYVYARIDGSQPVKNREEQLDRFHASGTSVLLMSLKCGVGLNLTCATTVVLTEPWWNPAVEEQAIDRAHRIGQTRPVRVLRLAVRDTIEETVLNLQQRKRELAADVLSDARAASTQPPQQQANRPPLPLRQRSATQLEETDILEMFGVES